MKDLRKILVLILTLLIGLTICANDSNIYNLVLHSKARGARCLDGSPTGMYIHEGTGANKDKYLIFFRGGGFCGGMTLMDTI